jgi:hypothetical protein
LVEEDMMINFKCNHFSHLEQSKKTIFSDTVMILELLYLGEDI